MITRDQVEELFDAVRKGATWSPDEICLWGYFFTDPDRAKLARAGRVLAGLGYHVVEILDPDDDDDDDEEERGRFFLHVEREEHHTVDTLDRRNAELYLLAEELGLEGYDGMDVGPRRPG